MQGRSLLSVLQARAERAEPPVTAYAAELVRGVAAHGEAIDKLLAANARGWTLERMPAVDRNILRIGAFELLWGAQVPDAVAISEAVLLATDLSTDASPAFVNGLLARLLEIKTSPGGMADAASATTAGGLPADADAPEGQQHG